jgi:hypothetical protein
MINRLIIAMLFLSLFLFSSCAGNDFHYDAAKHSIVSNHDNFENLNVEIADSHNKYLGECDLGEHRTDVIDIVNLASMASATDSNYSKLLLKPNTILTIRNSGGDAGSFTIKLLIDSNKKIKQIQ